MLQLMGLFDLVVFVRFFVFFCFFFFFLFTILNTPPHASYFILHIYCIMFLVQKSCSLAHCLTYVLLLQENVFVKVLPFSKLVSDHIAGHMKQMLESMRTSGREIVYETKTGGRKDISFVISLAPHTELSCVRSIVEDI